MVDQILLLLVSASAKLLLHWRVECKAGRPMANSSPPNLMAILIRDDIDLGSLIQQVLTGNHHLVARLDSAENLNILAVG